MATAVIAFRWLDVLEHEFDKAFVELDCMLPDMDCEEPELLETSRKKLSSLSSSFAQLVHKAQTIFQNNAKLEAQLLDYKDRMINCHCSSQLVINKTNNSNVNSEQMVVRLEKKYQDSSRENESLKQTVLALQGEVYGARLASKYLDQELAGRIQQLQLVCNPNPMNKDVQRKLWDQIESEIFLHRHKTVVKACRGQETPQSPQHTKVALSSNTLPAMSDPPQTETRSSSIPTEPRIVKLQRDDHSGLGISITGGSDHGLPILVSRVSQNSSAAGHVFVGDSILSVNSLDMRSIKHSEAAEVMSALRGEVTLELVYTESQESDAINISASNLKYEIFSEKVGYQLKDSTVADSLKLASQSSTTSKSDIAAGGEPSPHVSSVPDSGKQADTESPILSSELSTTSPTAAATVSVDSATSLPSESANDMMSNGAVRSSSTSESSSANNNTGDLDTDMGTAKSAAAQSTYRVGQYRMSNIQSLDESGDNSLFSSTD